MRYSNQIIISATGAISALAFFAGCVGQHAVPPTSQSEKNNSPAKVQVRKSGEKFQLYVNNQPFYIKGAGLEFGSQEKLAQHGGNSFRTWRTENGRDTGKAVLDRALSNGL